MVIKDEEEDCDMSLASEIASVASCAAYMERKDLENEVIKLRTQLVLAARDQKDQKAEPARTTCQGP